MKHSFVHVTNFVRYVMLCYYEYHCNLFDINNYNYYNDNDRQ